jgi:hypothetical protein
MESARRHAQFYLEAACNQSIHLIVLDASQHKFMRQWRRRRRPPRRAQAPRRRGPSRRPAGRGRDRRRAPPLAFVWRPQRLRLGAAAGGAGRRAEAETSIQSRINSTELPEYGRQSAQPCLQHGEAGESGPNASGANLTVGTDPGRFAEIGPEGEVAGSKNVGSLSTWSQPGY